LSASSPQRGRGVVEGGVVRAYPESATRGGPVDPGPRAPLSHAQAGGAAGAGLGAAAVTEEYPPVRPPTRALHGDDPCLAGRRPARIRSDNLKPAVVRILTGRDRVESERFVALRSHYGFDSFFCTPGLAGAHEKGGVEGEVGRFRRRHLVPVPRVQSLTELNA